MATGTPRVMLHPKNARISVQFEGTITAPALAFFQLISRRYGRGAIILPSNQSFGQWAEVFGDPIIATAILDRILHHSRAINIKGDSYRLKEKQKAGLLKKAPSLDNL